MLAPQLRDDLTDDHILWVQIRGARCCERAPLGKRAPMRARYGC